MTDIYNRPSPWKPYYYLHNRNSRENVPTNPTRYIEDVENIIGTDIGSNKIPVSGKYPIKSDSLLPVETKKDVFYKDNLWYTDKECQTKDLATTTISGFDPTKVENIVYKAVFTKPPFSRTINLNDYQEDLVEKPAYTRVANPSKVRMEIRYGRDNSIYQLVEVKVDYIKAPQFIRLTQDQIDQTEDTSQIMEYPDFICQKIINKLVAILLERSSDPRLTTNIQINRSMAQPAQPQAQQA